MELEFFSTAKHPKDEEDRPPGTERGHKKRSAKYKQISDPKSGPGLHSGFEPRSSWKKRNISDVTATSQTSTGVRKKSIFRSPPLHDAVRKGKVEELTKIIEEDDADSEEIVNAFDCNGLTALHLSAKFFSTEIATQLLDNGAHVNLKTPVDQSTALHYAVRYHNVDAASILLRSGADASLRDINGSSALHLAASRGLLSLVKGILDTGRVEIDVSDEKHYTPLHRAARGCETETCKVLLDRGASLDVTNANGETPLHLAAEENNTEVLEVFVEAMMKNIKKKDEATDAEKLLKCYIDKPRGDTKTALHIAAVMGHESVVKFLIKSGADVSAVTEQLATALHFAATFGNTDVMDLLLNVEGCAVDAKNVKGQTALHKATRRGKTDAMVLLLKHGANINMRDNKGCTALHLAVENNQDEAAKLLVEREAVTLIKNVDMQNVLHLACANGNFPITSMLLESNHKLIHSRDEQNQTAMHYAAKYGHLKILELLVSKTMQWRDQDITGQTPLHLAAQNGHVSCVALLSRDKQCLNFYNADQQTPLHVAVISGELEACKVLVTNRANVNCIDRSYLTPLHYAAAQENMDILNGLLGCEDIDINCEDDGSNTPLMVAADAGCHLAVACLMDAGVNLVCTNLHGENFFDIALELQYEHVCEAIVRHDRWQEALAIKSGNKCYYMNKLIEKYPDVAEIVLDRSCSFTDHPIDNPKFSVTYNYEFLEDYPEEETAFKDTVIESCKGNIKMPFAPSVMGKFQRQRLISHPIINSLFTLKWKRFARYLYYVSFFMYIVFVVSLNVTVLLENESYVQIRIKMLNKNQSNTEWKKGLGTLQRRRPSERKFGKALGSIVLVICIIHLIKEFVQVLVRRTAYFKNLVNYLELLLYSGSIYYILPFLRGKGVTKPLYEIGIMCIFLSWVNVMFFLQRVPMFRIYIVMLLQVSLSILKVCVVFSTIFMGFLLTFYMLFIRQTSFSNIGVSAAKTIVMMTGEFDYDDILTGNLGKRDAKKFPLVGFPTLSYIVFIAFLVFITLAFSNLLIGLAVGDIEKIREMATMTVQKQQLDFINSIRGVVPINLMRRHMTLKTYTEYLNKKTWYQRALQSDDEQEKLFELRVKLMKFESSSNNNGGSNKVGRGA